MAHDAGIAVAMGMTAGIRCWCLLTGCPLDYAVWCRVTGRSGTRRRSSAVARTVIEMTSRQPRLQLMSDPG